MTLKGWNGVLFVRTGFYESGIFKFNILFPLKYPLQGVKVQFVNKIFHPLINYSNGELDLKLLLKQEKENKKRNTNYDGKIVDIIQLIWNTFYDNTLLEISNSFNKEAF